MGLRENIAASRRAGHSEEDINRRIREEFAPSIQTGRTRNYSDDEIRKTLKAEQVPDVVINDLLGAPAVAPGPSRISQVGQRIRGAARRTGEAARAAVQPFRRVAAAARRAIPRITEPLLAEEDPGAVRLRERLARGPELGGRVAEAVARRGEEFPAFRGFLAGALPTAVGAAVPVPTTRAGGIALGAALAAPSIARVAGPAAFPVLGKDVGALLSGASRRLRRISPVRFGKARTAREVRAQADAEIRTNTANEQFGKTINAAEKAQADARRVDVIRKQKRVEPLRFKVAQDQATRSRTIAEREVLKARESLQAAEKASQAARDIRAGKPTPAPPTPAGPEIRPTGIIAPAEAPGFTIGGASIPRPVFSPIAGDIQVVPAEGVRGALRRAVGIEPAAPGLPKPRPSRLPPTFKKAFDEFNLEPTPEKARALISVAEQQKFPERVLAGVNARIGAALEGGTLADPTGELSTIKLEMERRLAAPAKRPTKKRAKQLLKAPETLRSQEGVQELIALREVGKLTPKQLNRVQGILTSRFINFAEEFGLEDPRTIQTQQAMAAFGFKPPTVRAPKPTAAPARAPAAPKKAPPAAEIKAIEKKAGKPLFEMTKAEFKAAAPDASPAIHTDAVRKAIRARRDIPRKVEEENLDIIEDFESELRGADVREMQRAIGSPTPMLDLAREKGLSIASLERTRGMGEVENLKGRGIFRQKGGVSISSLAEAANERGIIPENADNQAVEALNHELSTGQPLFPVRAMEFGPVSPISAVPGGVGGFAGPRPTAAAPPPPGEPLEQLQSTYETKIISGSPNTPRTSWPEAFDNLYTAYVDVTNPLVGLSRIGKDVPDVSNLKFLTRRWMGASGIAEANLRMRTSLLGKDGMLIDTGEALAWVLRDAEKVGLYRPLTTYMTAMRDLEHEASGKLGLDPKAAAKLVVYLKSKHGPPMLSLAERWWDWRVRVYLDSLLDIGVLSQKQYDAVRASGQVYGPFQRIRENLDTQGFVSSRGGDLFTPSGSPLKRFKGSDAPIVEPAETDIQMAYFYADYVERVRIGQAIWDSRKFSPELAKEIVEIKPKAIRLGTTKDNEPIFARSLIPPEKNAVPFIKEGKLRWMRVPRNVAESVRNMRAIDFGLGMEIFSFPAKVLRAGVILDPGFSLGRNPPRDVLQAAIFAKWGIRPTNLLRGLISAVTKNDRLYFKFLAGGGDMATLQAIDRADANIKLARLRGIIERQDLNPLELPIELLSLLSKTGEEMTRLAVIDRASRAGASDLEAIYEGRTATADFGMKGAAALSRAIRLTVPFHGASLAGMATMGKAFRERPVVTTYKSVLGVTLFSVIVWLMRLDDDELKEIPQWERDAFWVGKWPGTNRIWKLPKPHELGLFFGTAVEHILDFIFLNDPQAIRTLRDRIFDVVPPPIIPPLPKVVAEVWANKNAFTNRPIIPTGRERFAPELRFGTYTSETAKAIGKKLKFSPSQIDHIIRGLSGTLGTTVVKISDHFLRKLNIVDAPALPKGGGFLEGIIFAKPPIGSRSESVNRFFDISDELERKQATLRETSGLDLNPPPLLKTVRRARKQLKKLQSFVTLTRSRRLSPEEKAKRIERIEQRRTKIARQIVRRVENRRPRFKARSFFQREEVRPPQSEATKSLVTRSVRAFIDVPNQSNRKAMNEALREGAKADPELTLRVRGLVIRELSGENIRAAFEVFNEISEANRSTFRRELGQSEEGQQLLARLLLESRKRRGK